MEGRPRQDLRTGGEAPVRDQPPLPHPGGPAGEELEGIRAWLADIDRKLGTRTYAGAAAVVLATAAAIVAIVLAIDARDNSAGQGDVERLETQISDVAERAGAAQSTGQDLSALESRITELETQVGSNSTTTSDLEGRIAALESQIKALQGEASGAEPAPEPGAPEPGGTSEAGGPMPGASGGQEVPGGGNSGGTAP